MRTRLSKILVTAFLVLIGAATADDGDAAIIGTLEAPSGFASQVSNVQGWAYTTTPGAELVDAFDVRIDGVAVQQVPCCSDRGDVREAHAEAPLRTGFAGVLNWSREALQADGAVVLSVVVRDTAGGELVLEETLDLYAVASFPFSRSVAFARRELPAVLLADGPDVPVVIDREDIESRCALSNVIPPGGHPTAQLSCRGLTATKADGSDVEVCDGEIRFLWDRASQGFKQSSDCEEVERWTVHGDGTATDNETGLLWELKTGEVGESVECPVTGGPEACADPHDVDNRYDWSPGIPYLPDGSAFLRFLAQLNGGYSENGLDVEGCFAGYCDWRLPTFEELRGIVEPCPDEGARGSIPGPTAPTWHWSSTQDASGKNAWDVRFLGWTDDASLKTYHDAVRAVRGVAKRHRVLEPIESID